MHGVDAPGSEDPEAGPAAEKGSEKKILTGRRTAAWNVKSG